MSPPVFGDRRCSRDIAMAVPTYDSGLPRDIAVASPARMSCTFPAGYDGHRRRPSGRPTIVTRLTRRVNVGYVFASR